MKKNTEILHGPMGLQSRFDIVVIIKLSMSDPNGYLLFLTLSDKIFLHY
jgi:hypothetical protein